MGAYQSLQDANTVVIKIGTALVIATDGAKAKQEWLDALAKDVQVLIEAGKQVLIVSSGAVALGRNALDIPLDMPPSAIPLERKQASSAVGQFYLFQAYHQSFKARGLELAQVLLTMSETENRRMHLNARATLSELMARGIIPIVNENDTISTGELRFGDNDRLAARVAQMIGADVVLLLSTIDGLYTDNPANAGAEHIAVIDKIGTEHVEMAGEAVPGLSTGGMKSKVEAAKAANAAGIDLIVADGRPNHALGSVYSDESTRTSLFKAEKQALSAKKRWIGAHLSPKGAFTLDDGAKNALQSGKSLLPIGVKSVKGAFERGDVVEIQDLNGEKLGLGISAYSSADATLIQGQPSDGIQDILGYLGRPELIHRNDMVLVSSSLRD